MKNFYQLSILDYRIKYRTLLIGLLAVVAILISTAYSFGQTNVGNVVKVFDGDTVTFRKSNGKYYRVRLQGIDSPETRQTYGVECKALLDDITRGKTVTVMFYGSDAYKRMLGMLSTAEIPNINLYMIQQGCAWEYSAPLPMKTTYQTAEATARTALTGLWMDSCPTEPWAFRNHGYNICP